VAQPGHEPRTSGPEYQCINHYTSADCAELQMPRCPGLRFPCVSCHFNISFGRWLSSILNTPPDHHSCYLMLLIYIFRPVPIVYL